MAGISGLNRAAMEKDRLARIAAKENSSSKRARSPSPSQATRPAKIAKVQQTSGSSAKPIDLVDSPPPKTKEPTRTSASASTTPSYTLQYPTGVVKKTWAFGHPRSTDIKIEEVLEKSTLHTALLSAFMWDVHWVMSKIDLQQTKSIFVMQAKDEATKQQYRQETEYLRKVLRLCFPSMEGNVNCMHSKLMLLFHPHKLRVVVPSANLTSYDWGETGVMENTVFLIDLPRVDEAHKGDGNILPPFGQELLYFLEQMGCDEDVRRGVLNFDFSATKDFAFVHSTGGTYYGTQMERTGFVGLGNSVRSLNLATGCDLHIDFAASSIGSLTDEFLQLVHNAARGEDAGAYPRSVSRTAPKPFQNSISAENMREIFRIYFPTHETVVNSNGGTDSGGTICLQRKWWEGNNSFPRPCFRDYHSVRRGLLSHNKILYARGRNDKGKAIAWAYVGSANLSESAWGKLTWDRSRKEWKIGCRNWECGVLIPAPADKPKGESMMMDMGRVLGTGKEAIGKGKAKVKQQLPPDEVETESEAEDAETESEAEDEQKEVPGMHVFEGVVDVPFRYPGAEYNNKQPWYFME